MTSRDGRYVVPVRADSRAQVPGVVHDISASGQTIFVEPLEVVKINNRWREAQIEETREIDRILDELSYETGKHASELRQSVESVARIDFAMAKARLAFTMRATRPVVWSQLRREEAMLGDPAQRIRLRRARHPLLDAETVVPIDIDLGEDFRVLLDYRSQYGWQNGHAQDDRFVGGDDPIGIVHTRGRSIDLAGIQLVLRRYR